MILVVILLSQNIMMIKTNQWLVKWKIKHDINEHKKVKSVNKNVAATIIHGDYKDVLLH